MYVHVHACACMWVHAHVRVCVCVWGVKDQSEFGINVRKCERRLSASVMNSPSAFVQG